MIGLRPYINAQMRRLGRHVSLEDAATNIEVVEPESATSTPPVIALDGEFDRITRLAPGAAMEDAKSLVFGLAGVKRALIRYEFEDALVYPTGFSAGGGNFMRDLPLPHKQLLAGKITRLPKALCTHTPVSIRYFGHWIADSCPTALMKSDDEALLMTHRPEWPHAHEYCGLLDLDPEPAGVYHVDKLAWMDDFGQGESRSRRYRELRRRLRAHIGAAEQGESPARLVYLRRGSTGVKREIVNEDELIGRLSDSGFTIVDLHNASVADIMRRCMDAEICITLDGSHQNHAFFFMRDNGFMLILQPADRFSPNGIQRAHAFGLERGYVVTEAAPGGYVADADRILRTIDLWRKKRPTQSLV